MNKENKLKEISEIFHLTYNLLIKIPGENNLKLTTTAKKKVEELEEVFFKDFETWNIKDSDDSKTIKLLTTSIKIIKIFYQVQNLIAALKLQEKIKEITPQTIIADYLTSNTFTFKEWIELQPIIKNKSGFYRLYVIIKKKQYSYIGISTTCLKRIKTHFSNLKFALSDNNSINTSFKRMLYQTSSIDSSCAVYLKIALFLIYHQLDLKSLKAEVIRYDKNVNLNSHKTLKKEMNYIDKYDSELLGFNGVFAKDFAFSQMIAAGVGTLNVKKLQTQQNMKNQRYFELMQTNNHYMPWLYAQMINPLWKHKLWMKYLKKVETNIKKQPTKYFHLLEKIKKINFDIY